VGSSFRPSSRRPVLLASAPVVSERRVNVKTTIGSAPLAQEDAAALFAVVQDRIIELCNRTGRSCVVRRPTADELASVQTERELEALALTYTRPIA
jgi:hypothetical protein